MPFSEGLCFINLLGGGTGYGSIGLAETAGAVCTTYIHEHTTAEPFGIRSLNP